MSKARHSIFIGSNNRLDLLMQDHQGAGVHAEMYSKNDHVPFGSGCPLLAAS